MSGSGKSRPRARETENRPVLDVGFTAAEARSVHCERDRLEPSPLSLPNQLLHHIPVLVHLHGTHVKQP
jgi:hypothetical protein